MPNDDVVEAARRMLEWCEGSDGRPIEDARLLANFALKTLEHEWVPAPNRDWDMCAKCGFIRRADGKNKPCRGPVPILPRGSQ